MKAIRIVAAIAGLGIAAAGGVAWLATRSATPPAEAFLTVARGTPTRQLAAKLAEAGVVASPWHFLAARALRPKAILQTGEYRFAGHATAIEVLDRIVRGDVYTVEISIPEGYNLFEIAVAVEKSGLASRAEFLAAARDPGLIRDLAPAATSLEGYLFPDTYRVGPRVGAVALCRLFTRRFRTIWSRLGASAPVHRTVTLASLVEKETGRPDERATVASVYANRLAKGMKLDCDPTTIYAAMLEGRWRGTIYRSDLDSPHPYNTYQHSGLPPGPIANPGEASMRAALSPAKTDYVFFVALPDGSGRHQFSESYAAHEQAVAAYRKGTDAGKPQAAVPASDRVAKRKPGR